MKMNSHQSIAPTHPWWTILFFACLGATAGTTGCSTVPDWSVRETLRTTLTVHYGPSVTDTEILLPASTPDLLIEELEFEPTDLPQSFVSGVRRLHLPAGDQRVVVRCRYRLFRNHPQTGEPPAWRTPRQIFPGATRIERNH